MLLALRGSSACLGGDYISGWQHGEVGNVVVFEYTGIICKQQLRAKMMTGRPLIISKNFQLNCGSEDIVTPSVHPV